MRELMEWVAIALLALGVTPYVSQYIGYCARVFLVKAVLSLEYDKSLRDYPLDLPASPFREILEKEFEGWYEYQEHDTLHDVVSSLRKRQ